MDLTIYQDKIWEKGKGIFGTYDWREVKPQDLEKLPLLKAFLDDNDIQEMRIVSTNFGFIKTFRKEYKK